MKEERPVTQLTDICVCCGKPVPEGRMVCYACERESYTEAPAKSNKLSKVIRRIFGFKKERADDPRN